VFDPTPTWDVSPVAPFDSGAFSNFGDPEGLWSPWFGHGKVDARAAVAAAQRSQPEAGRTVRHASSPQLAIPDNDPAGVRHGIVVAETGLVREVRVSLEITHTWIGDLRVELEAPGGARVVLHDRAGAGADNIRRTYEVTNLPALASLRGGDMAGTWTLLVEDTAAQDVGVLNQWSLEIDAASAAEPEHLAAEETVSVRIPDANASGIARVLEVSDGGAIREVAVSVDITHPWIGDLRVTLTPPGGAEPIVLHNLSGGSADNLIRTWRSQELPALAALRGHEPAGQWELRVADTVRQDQGKLNSWKLEFEVSAATRTAAGPRG
jgi:subtilisin-like proprotein convertase family protein